MKGFIKRNTAAVWLGAALCLMGCQPLKYHLCDPCYPERYWYEARHNLNHLYHNQTNNGHVLDQTVWNYHFDVEYKKDPATGLFKKDPERPDRWLGYPTARLNEMGIAHLEYLVRRRPKADPKIYLQTAVDIPYNDAIPPEELASLRAQLDKERMQAINHFLVAHLKNRHHEYAFQIVVHDPGDVTLAATPIGGNIGPAGVPGAINQMYGSFLGVNSNARVTGVGFSGGGVSGGGAGGGGVAPGGAGGGGY